MLSQAEFHRNMGLDAEILLLHEQVIACLPLPRMEARTKGLFGLLWKLTK